MLCLSMSTSIIISITWGYFSLLPRASAFWTTILLDVFRREDSVNAHQRGNTLKPNWKTPPLLTSFFLFKRADSDPSLVLNILEGRKTTSSLKENTVAFKDQFILGLIHLNARTTRLFLFYFILFNILYVVSLRQPAWLKSLPYCLLSLASNRLPLYAF